MNTNLLTHQMDKFGVITVMDVLLLDTQTNTPILYLDTLKMTSINQESQQKEIRGGIGAPELISYDFARTITLEIQDALASMASLATLWGGSLVEGDYDYTVIFEATAGADGAIPVPAGIILKDDIDVDKVFAINASKSQSYDVTAAAGASIATDAAEGDTVKVFIPEGATSAGSEGAMALAINSIDMPPTVKMVGQTFFIDQRTGKKVPMQLEVPLMKINIEGGMAMEAEGDAAVFDFNAKALADPVTKEFFVLKQLGAPGALED